MEIGWPKIRKHDDGWGLVSYLNSQTHEWTFIVVLFCWVLLLLALFVLNNFFFFGCSTRALKCLEGGWAKGRRGERNLGGGGPSS